MKRKAGVSTSAVISTLVSMVVAATVDSLFDLWSVSTDISGGEAPASVTGSTSSTGPTGRTLRCMR